MSYNLLLHSEALPTNGAPTEDYGLFIGKIMQDKIRFVAAGITVG